jgi:hypothetical protein
VEAAVGVGDVDAGPDEGVENENHRQDRLGQQVRVRRPKRHLYFETVSPKINAKRY